MQRFFAVQLIISLASILYRNILLVLVLGLMFLAGSFMVVYFGNGFDFMAAFYTVWDAVSGFVRDAADMLLNAWDRLTAIFA